jgi:DNA-binding NarL/FixJ family response regulator
VRLVDSAAGFSLLGSAADRPGLDALIDQHPRRRRHRHPHAADQHRRGHRGGRPATHQPPRHRVVLISQFAEATDALTLLADGTGYLLKERVADGDELADAIRLVAEGGSVIDPTVIEDLVAANRKHTNPIFSKLGLSEERDLNRRVGAVLVYLQNR